MTTDTTEKGLETLIMRHMPDTDVFAVTLNMVAKRRAPYNGAGANGQEDSITQVSFDGKRVREDLVWGLWSQIIVGQCFFVRASQLIAI